VGRPNWRVVAVGVAASAVAVTGCDDHHGGVSLAVPTPTGSVARDCATLIASLPDNLAPGGHRRTTSPASPVTAAFGDPPVTVRCGVPVPQHPPTSLVEEFNGVDWLRLGSSNTGTQHYVSYASRLVVDVRIPDAYLPANILLGFPANQLLAPGAPAATSSAVTGP
jgi:hypothetical protein